MDPWTSQEIPGDPDKDFRGDPAPKIFGDPNYIYNYYMGLSENVGYIPNYSH